LKRLLRIAIVFGLTFGGLNHLIAQKGSRITTVVIDAGHGGKDPGAIGKHSKEKNIALAVALKTGKYIEEYLPDVKVIYTRTTDRFVELYKRAQIANKANADFFISIHCNANRNSRSALISSSSRGFDRKTDMRSSLFLRSFGSKICRTASISC